ncbi:MAG: DUF928 domain-containing protein [Cyanobacteria bacterium J06639_14]
MSIVPGQAQSQFPTAEEAIIQFSPPPLGDRDRPPGRTRGGASRGDCEIAENQSSLMALAPSTQVPVNETQHPTFSSHPYNNESDSYESVLSWTTESHPSFWFYVPYERDTDVTLDFVLQDGSGNTLYQTQFMAHENSPGVIQLSLPATLPPLSVNQPYRWYFLTHCNASPTEGALHVEGWIVRMTMDSDFQAQVEASSELEKASLYAANGIWQDALTILGSLYRENPQNTTLTQNWMSLLASVGLAEISEQPLIDCCVPTQREPISDSVSHQEYDLTKVID